MNCKGADNISGIWMRLFFCHQKNRLKQRNKELENYVCAICKKGHI